MKNNVLEKLAVPRRFERPAFAFGGQRSIQLSYGTFRSSVFQYGASNSHSLLLRASHAPVYLPLAILLSPTYNSLINDNCSVKML
jgi:hypothetical protein